MYGASSSLSEGKMVVAAVMALDSEGVREEEVELLVVRMRLWLWNVDEDFTL